MNSFLTHAGVVAGLVASAAAVQAQIASAPEALEATSLQRIDVSQFRADDPTIFAEPVDASGGSAAGVCWDNGAPDGVTAHQAQQTSIGFFRVADDLFIKRGEHKQIREVCVCFLVSDTIDGTMFKPVVGLDVYTDCDGRPDPGGKSSGLSVPPRTVGIDDGVTGTNNGPSAQFPGFNEWEFCFELDEFISGPIELWISPYGVADITGPGSGLYFWRSAGNGRIQGAQGQLKNGAEPWMDVQTCDCPGICTDFCFQIYGDLCCLLKDSAPFDETSGSKSIQLFGAQVDTARAADNFQVPPGPMPAVDLCRIEAWVATNCPLDKLFLEIYENDCDRPGAKVCTIDLTDDADGDGVADQPAFEDTGLDYQGCNIYRLTWSNLGGVALDSGRNYWLSVVARGTGSILDKAFWMHKSHLDACAYLNITEGKVKDPFVEGLEDWLPISEAEQLRFFVHHDLAFRVYTAVPTEPLQPLLGACCFGLTSGGETLLCEELDPVACAQAGGEFFPLESCENADCFDIDLQAGGGSDGATADPELSPTRERPARRLQR